MDALCHSTNQKTDLHLEIGQYKYYTTGSVYDQLKVDWASKFSALIIDERRWVDRISSVGTG